MFTSRAEYRMSLREDNADVRLHEQAYRAGLICQTRYERVSERQAQINQIITQLEQDQSVEALDEQALWLIERAQIHRCYAGYISRQQREIDRIRGEGTQDLPLPAHLDYSQLSGLTREAAERLTKVRPISTGQAARIPGLTPGALMCLWAHARAAQRQQARSNLAS